MSEFIIPAHIPASSPSHMRTNDYNQIPFSELVSEQWLLERSYHAHLLNGRELSIANLTKAMGQLTDSTFALPSSSVKASLPERLLRKKSSTHSIPISTWREITQEEARAAYEQGIPVLLSSEQDWEQAPVTSRRLGPKRNIRAIVFGNALLQPKVISSTTHAVCYLDVRQGTFANMSWKTWFSSDPDILLRCQNQSITFLCPCILFPFTTHYTVIAPDGHISEYPDRIAAFQGFIATPLQEVSQGNTFEIVAPHFCYYHEVTCPSGIYRLEFFGPHMNEQGYLHTESFPALPLEERSS
ncbi:MAG TPA: hypothetical protein VFN35_09495 [Ktedonobacteraceae bacterium]|nr:hypothetical protein [Ktedonobacteraceae bacterium]